MWWPFRKKRDVCTPEQASRIWADALAKCFEEDRLLDEWFAGPGKEWPKVTVMLRRTEVSAPEPFEDYAPGWVAAFEEYKNAAIDARTTA